MKIGKVQGFLQGFLRACKKHFDENRSESGLWDEFIARICKDYAEDSDSEYLQDLAMITQETNVVFFNIPVKYLKEGFPIIQMSNNQIAELDHAKVESVENLEKETTPAEVIKNLKEVDDHA